MRLLVLADCSRAFWVRRQVASLFLLCTILFLALPLSAHAGCVPYDEYVQSIAQLPIPGSAEGIAIEGHYAYIAAYDAGLVVVDVSEPSTPYVVGQIDLPGLAVAVAIQEGSAYVVGVDCGLQVVDVREPSDPRMFGSCDVPGEGRDVDVSGSTVLIAAWTDDLQIVDVTFPNIPHVVGQLSMPYAAAAVAVDPEVPSLGYVVDYYAYAMVVDFSTPSTPRVLGQVSLGGNPTDCAYAEGLLYVSAGSSFNIVNVAEPDFPEVVEVYSVGWAGLNVAVSGTRVYASSESGLAAIDVEDPEAADYLWRLLTLAECTGVAMGDERAFVIQGSLGLEVFDVGHEGPVLPFGALDLGEYAGDLAASDDQAFVIEEDGLSIVDISDAHSPVLMGRLDLAGEAPPRAVTTFGNLAFLAMEEGLSIVDVSEPAAPFLVETMPDGDLTDLVVVGEFLYVADQDGYLRIYGLSGGTTIERLGVLQLDPNRDSVFGIAVQGDHAYVSDRRLGFFVVDITNPWIPETVGFAAGFGLRSRIKVEGNWAYLVGSNFHIADIADPTAPEIVTTVSLYGFDVEYRDTFAYVMLHDLGVALYDVSDPYTPAFRGMAYRHLFEWFPPGPPNGLTIHDGNLLFTDANKLQVAPVQCGPTVSTAELAAVRSSQLIARPNPSRGAVQFGFDLPFAARVNLAIFDLAGRRVRILVDGYLQAGAHSVDWTGRDRAGHEVPGGAYLVRLSGPVGVERGRFVLLR